MLENEDLIRIIHNPRCSKSREALSLLEARGYKLQTIDYLKGELTKELLEEVLSLLRINPGELLRSKEEEYKTLRIDLHDQDDVISAILKTPILLERPIVIKGNKAVIGRPPEKVLELLA